MTAISFDDLRGKVCVVTGGGGVIGASLGTGLAAAGIRVVVLDQKREAADRVVQSLRDRQGATALGVACDVLDRTSLEQALETIHGELGPDDLLINGAGGNSPRATTKAEVLDPGRMDDLADTFFGLELEGFRAVFDLNFLGTVLPTMVFTRDMLRSGRGAVLNISSMNAFRPLTRIPAYSAAKAAVNNFTEWLAVHFARTNIRVNAIAPGFLLTDQNRFLLVDEASGQLTARGGKILAATPMGRFGAPDELLGTTLFLLSDLSRFVTGVVVPIDGGFHAYSGV